uniref:Uncharacterized protein n=1 Tax=Solanum tuberosum TaxID=4113 RepID=M1DMY6_SOLTU
MTNDTNLCFSSLFPIGDNASANGRFSASPNKFLLRRVLQNFSAAVDVQTAVTTGVVDQHSNAPIFNPRSRVINQLPFSVLACSSSSLFPIGNIAMYSGRFGASPNKFLLRRVLQNFSAGVDVQTAVTTRVADQVGKSPKPSYAFRVLPTPCSEGTLSQTYSNAPIFNPRSRVINQLPFSVLACSSSSLFPIGNIALYSGRFGASPNKFLLRRVLQNFSAAVDVQTAVTTRVADEVGKLPTPSCAFRVLPTPCSEGTLSQTVK